MLIHFYHSASLHKKKLTVYYEIRHRGFPKNSFKSLQSIILKWGSPKFRDMRDTIVTNNKILEYIIYSKNVNVFLDLKL
jgi:hypothetical protein